MVPDVSSREATKGGDMRDENGTGFEGLLDLLRFLRSPEGCEWDRSREAKDLKPYLLEECHELLEAIDRGDPAALAGEIGDLLLHCAFLTVLGEESGAFDAREVFARIEAKMKRRHPHLFGEEPRAAPAEPWEVIKSRERDREGRTGILDGLPASLPPLIRAFRLQERVSALKFDWASPEGAFRKVEEELEEVDEAHRAGDRRAMAGELGDLLFAAVNLSRLLGVHPDEALSMTVRKFAERFDRLAERARRDGLVLGEAGLDELDRIWEAIKKEDRDAGAGDG
jgi:tetrapyrrole methylase family protein/MazG family protein